MKRILAVVVAWLLVFGLLPCSGSAQSDNQASKAVRRTSSEPGTSAKDQKRVALIIGNSAYPDVPLRNPGRDAQDISTVLQGLGFTVQTKINANHRQMDEAVNEFIQKVRNGDVALFYFSGHGVQVKGENYLIPVGGTITSEADVHYSAVNVGRILANLEESKNKINIVVLDACRNNPFKGFRSYGKGLSPVDAPVGTFIAYATSPGSVAADGTGTNSPYTKHLLQALKVDGSKIEDAFKQVLRSVWEETAGKQTPWYASCLKDDFYFKPTARVSTQPVGSSLSELPPVKRYGSSKDRDLIEAAFNGKIDDVKRLLSQGAAVNMANTDVSPNGHTALTAAAERGHVELVKILLNKGAAVNGRTMASKNTPLICAASTGRTVIVKMLLEKRADVNLVNWEGATALMLAVKHRNTEVAEILRKYGAKR